MGSSETRPVSCPRTGKGEFVEFAVVTAPCLSGKSSRKQACSVLGVQATDCSGSCLDSK